MTHVYCPELLNLGNKSTFILFILKGQFNFIVFILDFAFKIKKIATSDNLILLD
ncbi:hypothetical protein Runsl_0535 [Runella slithyformis DSM 19594]|uniref:Uncharacterized protein n=1 Tax=Runella slithyformis (strain ATCC 29530 / DSM 19594 / LMG 11500 / NCIMB 11436 / LSU 4) TaxID=761193 RepID=A0A7U4E4E4_RUNSL|nr:hypothetical protein Runsl_0535 [Runella slithyformis DSM 19594]